MFFFNETPPTEIYTLSLPDALPISATPIREDGREADLAALIGPVLYDVPWGDLEAEGWIAPVECVEVRVPLVQDRKSTRLNSSHANISYAVFCLKKKNTISLHPASP